MFNFYLYQPNSIDWTTIIISILSAIIGAFIAGHYTSKATEEAHKNNLELQKNIKAEKEKAVALSIMQELSSLKNAYEKDMDEMFDDINNYGYLCTGYTITQDFTTVFTNNSGNLGLITNKEIRDLIVNCYILLKKYFEYLSLYDKDLDNFYNKRRNFVSLVYHKLINMNCTDIIDINKEVDDIKKRYNNGGLDSIASEYISNIQVVTFINSDDSLLKYLNECSLTLQNQYNGLKKIIITVIEKIKAKYGEI